MGILYGRAGRLTALFGGFRPGQFLAANWMGAASMPLNSGYKTEEFKFEPGLRPWTPGHCRLPPPFELARSLM
jgi:hypothetical protein